MAKDFNTKAYTAPTNIYMVNGPGYAGECTTYAWGRAYEKLGYSKMKNLPNKMAKSWYNASHGYSKGQIPQANSIACFTGESGHVVFVERLSGDGKMIYFSEANWYNDDRCGDGYWDPAPEGTDGTTQSLTVEDFKERSDKLTFQGFIYLA